jgi:hypothetical protein
MLFSFEMPIAYLKECQEINDYDFILAHMLLKDKDYATFYKQSTKFKILDNGCAELGKSIPTDELIKLAVDYKVNMLVLPDIWMNGKSTLVESENALQDIKKNFPKEYERLRFMFVIQGNSLADFQKCYTTFEGNRYLDSDISKITYGLPYLTCAKILSPLSPTNRDDDVTNARIRLIQQMDFNKEPDNPSQPYNIHLLGAGFNFSQEISFMRHYSNVFTADTSTPYILAANGIMLKSEGLFDRIIGKSGTLDLYASYDEQVAYTTVLNANRLKSFGRL